jgi:hypothetical protein
MKVWLADLLWGALVLVSKRLFNFLTDPGRAQKLRFAHREKWHAYYTKAQKRNSPSCMRLAEWYAIVWKFETPPLQAIGRGDLNRDNAKAGGAQTYACHS